MEITYSDDNGDEITVELPSKFVVCPNCEGHGTHLNNSMRNHAYSLEEFEYEFDEEEKEHYFRRGGMYDVVCEACGGNRVVSIVDEDRLSSEDMKHFLAYQAYLEEEHAYDRMCAIEREYGY